MTTTWSASVACRMPSPIRNNSTDKERCTETELAAVEVSVMSSFAQQAGGLDRPLRFDASCHFAIAR